MQETYQAVIVEDDPMIASIDQNFLERDPRFHLAASFRSGQDALPWLLRHPADLLILDVYMPRMTGLELLRELRSFGITSDVVMVTAANDSKTVNALLKLGVADYLVKPFTEADIDALTDELLARVPQPDKYMELKVEGSEIHLRYQDIVYAEHFAHLIYVHTTVQKTLATRQPFKTFIAPLKDDTRFFVCGRGVIVNLEHAKDLEGAAFRMADGSRVFVSQDLLKSARQAFMEFLLQRGRMV